MIVIVDNISHMIEAVFNNLEFTTYNYPVDRGSNTVFPTPIFDYYDISKEDIPEDAVYYEPERGFYKYPVENEMLQQIKDDTITEVQKGVTNGEM